MFFMPKKYKSCRKCSATIYKFNGFKYLCLECSIIKERKISLRKNRKMTHVLIEGLLYISRNKVRIASFRYKCDKEVIKDYLYLINTTDRSEHLMSIGLTVEDVLRTEELIWKNKIYKLIRCAADNCLIKKDYFNE